MHHVMTHLTGMDLALALALLVTYLMNTGRSINASAGGLDRAAQD